MMTWKDVLTCVQHFTDEELQQTATTYDRIENEFHGIIGIGKTEEDDVLDKGHFYLEY